MQRANPRQASPPKLKPPTHSARLPTTTSAPVATGDSTTEEDGSVVAPTMPPTPKAKAAVRAPAKPESALARRLAYSETVEKAGSSRRRDKRIAKRKAKLEAATGQADAHKKPSVAVGKRKGKPEAALPASSAKKRKIAATAPTIPAAARARAAAPVPARARAVVVALQAAERAALAHADMESRIVQLLIENQQLRAELAAAHAANTRMAAPATSPRQLSPLGSLDVSWSPSTAAWSTTTSPLTGTAYANAFNAMAAPSWSPSIGIDPASWRVAAAAVSPSANIEPFRAACVSLSPCHVGCIGLSPLGPLTPPAVPTAPASFEAVAPTNAAASESALELWPTRGGVDDILDVLAADEDDAEVQVEPPTTPSTVADNDGTSSVWSVDSL